MLVAFRRHQGFHFERCNPNFKATQGCISGLAMVISTTGLRGLISAGRSVSTVFSECLAPLRARLQGQRPVIRHVLRVWFDQTDKSAFEVSIDLRLKWMTARASKTTRSGLARREA